MKILRFALKILLFPISLVLSLLVSIGRFLTHFASILLYILALILIVLGICTLIVEGICFPAVAAFVIAWLCSPFGLPYLVTFLVEVTNLLNRAIRNI